jgi:membrane fusion protein, copper/silver efflux system
MTRIAPGHEPQHVQTTGRSQGPIWRRAGRALKLAQVRLRVPIVLVAAALVVGRWELIRNYWDRTTRGTFSDSTARHAVSADTEYFCPMDPGVVSDWPSRCGICNMALVRRKRGEALALPDGVVARMQLSPYRIQLAGIQTAPAKFQPLMRGFESTGITTRTGTALCVLVDVPARQAPWIAQGQSAELTFTDLPGRDAVAGRVGAVETRSIDGWEYLRATITVVEPPRDVRAGMIAVVRVATPMAALEPFRSMPADPRPLSADEPRVVFACADHPDDLAVSAGRCPIDKRQRDARPLADLQRLRWWCPMHPDVTADRPGSVCAACGGMVLKPRVISFAPAGQVLTVPTRAVVDAGQRKVVFVETMPGMFDGIEVVVGPRCGDSYPIVRGLEAGQRVAVAGAFLLDAETRLNPSLAAGYFGAGRGERGVSAGPLTRSSEKTAAADKVKFAELAPEDRPLAERQRVCPVTNEPLGSMGTPARVVVSGQVVFLCCQGCEGTLKRDPAKYLAKLSKH